jgi:sugar lactone lactonase YvrE
MKTTILADTLKFPECPRWHDGALWCSDLFAQKIVRVDLHGHVETVAELQDTPTSLGWTPEGQLLVVSAFACRLLRLEGGGLAEVADLSGLVPYPCNDMVIDRQSRAYIGNMGYDFGDDHAIGRLEMVQVDVPGAGLP